MTLSRFIRDNMEAILDEWQQFAVTIPSAGGMEARALRNDAGEILFAIALDMESSQSDAEQVVKSRGRKARNHDKGDTAAETHGGTRFFEGFTLNEMVSEYRALRYRNPVMAGEASKWRAGSPLRDHPFRGRNRSGAHGID